MQTHGWTYGKAVQRKMAEPCSKRAIEKALDGGGGCPACGRSQEVRE